MKTITTILFFLCLNIQAQDLSLQQQAIDRLAVLEGQWQGSGWMVDPQGKRSEFTQTEDVQRKLNGTALLIEGNGYANDSLVFQAMATATYDAEKQKYRFHSHLADGRYTEAEGWFDSEDIFHWQFPVPNGTVRYSIEMSKTNWLEKGAYQPKDREEWYPFMQMELTKLK